MPIDTCKIRAPYAARRLYQLLRISTESLHDIRRDRLTKRLWCRRGLAGRQHRRSNLEQLRRLGILRRHPQRRLRVRCGRRLRPRGEPAGRPPHCARDRSSASNSRDGRDAVLPPHPCLRRRRRDPHQRQRNASPNRAHAGCGPNRDTGTDHLPAVPLRGQYPPASHRLDRRGVQQCP